MNEQMVNSGQRETASPGTHQGAEPQPRETREDHRAWALRWDGIALSAARGRKRNDESAGA